LLSSEKGVMAGEAKTTKQMKDHLYVACTFPTRREGGGFHREAKPAVHFGMVDSGSQIGCVHDCMLNLYPEWKKYFHPAEATITGIGGIKCKVTGDLKRLPISFGTAQKDSTLYYVDLKVIVGCGYFLLFGLDLLDRVDAKLEIRGQTMNIRCNTTLGKGRYELQLYTRSLVRI
jgi:hypothetical protein